MPSRRLFLKQSSLVMAVAATAAALPALLVSTAGQAGVADAPAAESTAAPAGAEAGDLGDLRPFEEFHNMYGLNNTGLGLMAAGINSTDALNVHSIALQVPVTALTRSGRKPTGVTDPVAVIGVWTSASRRKVRVLPDQGPRPPRAPRTTCRRSRTWACPTAGSTPTRPRR